MPIIKPTNLNRNFAYSQSSIDDAALKIKQKKEIISDIPTPSEGQVTDVRVNNSSVVDSQGVAYIPQIPTITVSSDGTSTNEVKYITINNIEYKIANGSAGTIQDVQVDNVSVVTNGVAKIDLSNVAKIDQPNLFTKTQKIHISNNEPILHLEQNNAYIDLKTELKQYPENQSSILSVAGEVGKHVGLQLKRGTDTVLLFESRFNSAVIGTTTSDKLMLRSHNQDYLEINADGSVRAINHTIPLTDNSNQVATTEWVRQQSYATQDMIKTNIADMDDYIPTMEAIQTAIENSVNIPDDVATLNDLPSGEIDLTLTNTSISDGTNTIEPILTINNQKPDSNGDFNLFATTGTILYEHTFTLTINHDNYDFRFVDPNPLPYITTESTNSEQIRIGLNLIQKYNIVGWGQLSARPSRLFKIELWMFDNNVSWSCQWQRCYSNNLEFLTSNPTEISADTVTLWT